MCKCAQDNRDYRDRERRIPREFDLWSLATFRLSVVSRMFEFFLVKRTAHTAAPSRVTHGPISLFLYIPTGPFTDAQHTNKPSL